eukprot:1150009-Pelagomonas_calceolata.AAC.3
MEAEIRTDECCCVQNEMSKEGKDKANLEPGIAGKPFVLYLVLWVLKIRAKKARKGQDGA